MELVSWEFIQLIVHLNFRPHKVEPVVSSLGWSKSLHILWLPSTSVDHPWFSYNTMSMIDKLVLWANTSHGQFVNKVSVQVPELHMCTLQGHEVPCVNTNNWLLLGNTNTNPMESKQGQKAIKSAVLCEVRELCLSLHPNNLSCRHGKSKLGPLWS